MNIVTKKNDFAEVSKNLASYRSENNLHHQKNYVKHENNAVKSFDNLANNNLSVPYIYYIISLIV